jgi:hypothetical protein
MFEQASAFNQELKDWDVSSGTDFVSSEQTEQNSVFTVTLVWHSFKIGFRVESITD